MTLHIFLDLPTIDAANKRIKAGDRVLDLSFITPNEPIKRLITTQLDASWIDHDMTTPAAFERARHDFLMALSDMAQMPLFDAQTLRSRYAFTQKNEPKLSLWWFTQISERRLRIDRLPQMLLRRWWLVRNGGLAHLSAILKNQTTYTLWSGDAQMSHFWINMLTNLGIHHTTPDCITHTDGTPHQPVALEIPKTTTLKLAWQHGRILKRYTKLQALMQTTQRKNIKRNHDLLIVTYANGWHTSAEQSPRHRYFHDIMTACAREGIRVAWTPMALLQNSLKTLTTTLHQQPHPVAWESLAITQSDILALDRQLKQARKTLRRDLPNLNNHPALSMFGQDISSWVIRDLIHTIEVDALKFTLTKLMTQRALEGTMATHLLYRDEFYLNGRAISAAQVPKATKLAMQHGLITEDHWTYLNPKQDIEGEFALPTPDNFMTYGQYPQQLMSQWGYPTKALSIVGSLRHDEMILRTKQTTTQTDNIDLPQDQPTFVICTQLIDQIPGWIERLVCALRLADVQAHIAIKQHHFHRADDLIKETFKRLNWTAYSIHQHHLEALLQQGVAALTENSTTGIEALIWGTPLICFNEDQRYESFPYVTDGGALSGATITDMARSIKTVLYEPQQLPDSKMFLQRHLNNVKAPATIEFFKLIQQDD